MELHSDSSFSDVEQSFLEGSLNRQRKIMIVNAEGVREELPSPLVTSLPAERTPEPRLSSPHLSPRSVRRGSDVVNSSRDVGGSPVPGRRASNRSPSPSRSASSNLKSGSGNGLPNGITPIVNFNNRYASSGNPNGNSVESLRSSTDPLSASSRDTSLLGSSHMSIMWASPAASLLVDTTDKSTIDLLAHGAELVDSHQYEHAVSLLNALLEQILLGERRGDEVVSEIYYNLGLCHQALSSYSNSAVYFIASQKFYSRQKNIEGAFAALLQLSHALLRTGDSAGVLRHVEPQLKHLEDKRDPALLKKLDGTVLFHCYQAVALAHKDLGEYDEALQFLLSALSFIDLQNSLTQAVFYQNLGALYNLLERYTDSFKCHEQAIMLFQNIGAEKQTAIVHENYGYAKVQALEYLHAKEHYQAALDYWTASNSLIEHVLTSQRLGTALFLNHEYEDAIKVVATAKVVASLKGWKDLEEELSLMNEDITRAFIDASATPTPVEPNYPATAYMNEGFPLPSIPDEQDSLASFTMPVDPEYAMEQPTVLVEDPEGTIMQEPTMQRASMSAYPMKARKGSSTFSFEGNQHHASLPSIPVQNGEFGRKVTNNSFYSSHSDLFSTSSSSSSDDNDEDIDSPKKSKKGKRKSNNYNQQGELNASINSSRQLEPGLLRRVDKGPQKSKMCIIQ